MMDYISPKMFWAEGSTKIFRDDVFSRLRFVCQADHRHYKENGFYQSFPQNDKFFKKMAHKIMFMTKFKKFRKWFYDNVTKELYKPIHRVATNPNKQ